MKKSIFTRNPYIIILLVIFIIGFIIRTTNLQDNLFFGYDQARDFQRVNSIVNEKNIKLLGPETYIPGLFNSPLYYYMVSPIFFISRGNPNITAVFHILLNLLVIFMLYQFSIVLFKKSWIGIIAALLWTISFEQVNFARHLSHASFMSLFTMLFFLGLSIFIFNNKKIGLYISVFGIALAIHMNIYLIYLVLLYPFLYFVYRPKINIKTLGLNILLLCFLLSSFFLAEIKFKFMGINSLFKFVGISQSSSINVMENLSNYIQRLTETIFYSFFSFNHFWAFLLFILMCYLLTRLQNNKALFFIFIITLSTLPLFAYKSSILETAMVNSTVVAPLTIIFAASIYYLLADNKLRIAGIFLLLIIIFSNISLLVEDNFIAIKRLAYQNLILKEEKNVIDYTYKGSGGNKFSVCAITNPLFVNTIWSYLYHWYGGTKYNYVPYWSGQKQYVIESLIPYDNDHVSIRYLIIEPLIGITDFARRATIFAEDQVSILEEEKKFGEIVIQKRKLENNKELLKDTQNLEVEEVVRLKSLLSTTDPRYSCFVNY